MSQLRRSPLEARLRDLEIELGNREYEIALLKEIGDAVISELDLERVLRLVADRAQKVIQAETVLVPIIDKNCTEYTYRAGCGTHSEDIVGQTLPLDFGICGWVWRHRRPWWRGVLEELNEDERNVWERDAGSVILVPLAGKRHFLGGLAGINKIGGGDFDERDLHLLTMFANQASIAIENATLFQEVDLARQKSDTYRKELQALNMQLAEMNKELEHLALHDELTGLANRSLIHDRLERAIKVARRENARLSIIMMDLDHFKEVNDTLGHNIGDRLLQRVAQRTATLLREADMVGRLGGDEFAIILPDVDANGAMQVAGKIIDALEAPFEVEDNSFLIAASMGIAAYPEHGDDATTLLRRADVAMYAAKQGREGYFIYNQAVDTNNTRRLARLGELREAVNNRDFELYYQPKIDVQSGRLIGVEALARWRYAPDEFISPADFIPMMEQTGLIKPFTLWALDSAMRQCAQWRHQGLDVTVAVNISMHNLRDTRLLKALAELRRRWDLPEGSLVLEVTESAVMHDPKYVLDILHRIDAMGIGLAIDDFGTGYSSLSYLKRMPVDELKIDKSFVLDMAHNRDDAMIVHSIIELAHNLELKVVAEGVESDRVVKSLRATQCDSLQGYHVCRPLPVHELDAFIAKARD